MTKCLGMGCKIKKSCLRYQIAPTEYQSYIAGCKGKEAFVGIKRKSKKGNCQ